MQKTNLIDEDRNICPCCINCSHFGWWDGDWCCTWHMKIIQHGDIFTDEILDSICTSETCKDYEVSNLPWVEDYESQIIKELSL